jgi:hypothetical protein
METFYDAIIGNYLYCILYTYNSKQDTGGIKHEIGTILLELDTDPLV